MAKMKATPQPKLTWVDVGNVVDRPGDNPNMLSDPQFHLLVNAIKKLGFLQPVTARPLPEGRYELIDGHHRMRAARAAGLAQVPVLVTNATDAEAAAEMLSLNRLRGDLDLGRAASVLKELSEIGFEDLTLTGFNGGEIQALLKELGTTGTSALDDIGNDGGVDVEPMQTAKRFAVRLVFDREEDRDTVRAVALANGSTVESGILSICEGIAKEIQHGNASA